MSMRFQKLLCGCGKARLFHLMLEFKLCAGSELFPPDAWANHYCRTRRVETLRVLFVHAFNLRHNVGSETRVCRDDLFGCFARA